MFLGVGNDSIAIRFDPLVGSYESCEGNFVADYIFIAGNGDIDVSAFSQNARNSELPFFQ